MKKVYIYNVDNNIIDNVEKVHVSNIDMIPNGSCSVIVCDCLDSIDLQNRINLFDQILKKAGIGCSVILKFISLKLFGKYIYNDKLDTAQINQLLNICRSMIDESTFNQMLNSYNNFTIKENTYTGLMRQVTLERTR